MPKPDTLVVNVDSQVDFVMQNGLLPVAGAEAIIAPGIRFLAGLDPAVIAASLFTFDTHQRETFIGSPENLGNPEVGEPGFNLHCEKGTPGWENVFNPRIVPAGIPVHTLEKGVFDMWAEKYLDVHQQTDNPCAELVCREDFFGRLREDGVNKAVVIGVAADFCVKFAVKGLLERGFQVTVPAHLTRGIIRQIDQVAAEDFAGAALTISE